MRAIATVVATLVLSGIGGGGWASSADQPVFMVVNVASHDVLNMRAGPAAHHPVVGRLAPDARGVVRTGDCDGSWCPVRHAAGRGWVNSLFLASIESAHEWAKTDAPVSIPAPEMRDPADAPRSCLTREARALLERIEEKFGPVQLVSTCRPGATIRGTSRPSRHASGNAVDFNAGSRKDAILQWLVANHHSGGTMTYVGMDHIHVDIGPHFVSIAGGLKWASWDGTPRNF